MRFFAASLYISATLLASSITHSAPLLIDGFETGDLSAKSSQGFGWDGPNATGVVSKSSVGSHDGNYSLRFSYPAGKDWSEQRFDLGGAYRDLWIRYWVRVPTNFSHGATNPTNHKFFAIWMDDYEAHGQGPTVAWEFWNNGSGGSNINVRYVHPAEGISTSHMQGQPFISVPADRGRWMQVVLHLKASTNSGSNDGVIQMWRRWESESTFTKLHELLNADIASPANGPNGWHAGYIFGWANAAYAANTEWLLDEFTVSTESLLSLTAATTAAPPSAPVLIMK